MCGKNMVCFCADGRAGVGLVLPPSLPSFMPDRQKIRNAQGDRGSNCINVGRSVETFGPDRTLWNGQFGVGDRRDKCS